MTKETIISTIDKRIIILETVERDVVFTSWMNLSGFIEGCYWCDVLTVEEFNELSDKASKAYLKVCRKYDEEGK